MTPEEEEISETVSKKLRNEKVIPQTYWDDSFGKFVSLPLIVILKGGTLCLATCERYPDDDEYIWYSHDSERWILNGEIVGWTDVTDSIFTDLVMKRYNINQHNLDGIE